MIDIKEKCPDYKRLEPGDWSDYTFSVDDTEFSLYREDDGSFTLFGNRNDEVVFCGTVNMES